MIISGRRIYLPKAFLAVGGPTPFTFPIPSLADVAFCNISMQTSAFSRRP